MNGVAVGAELSEAALDLLLSLYESDARGTFAVACDGDDRPLVRLLEDRGLAQWRGTNWGASFWSITDAGREAVRTSIEIQGH